MRKRNSPRYGSEVLPEDLSKVTISFGVGTSLESEVENICAHGIRVSIPDPKIMSNIPKINDTVKVLIPKGHHWITGICVYVTNESDGAVSTGINFYHPSEQNYLNILLSSALDVLPQPDSFISHEWEEFVGKLCNSEDPCLNGVGHQELGLLKGARGE